MTERGSAFFGLGSKLATAPVALSPDSSHELVVEMTVATKFPVGGLELYAGHTESTDLLGEAEAVAAAADVAVVVVGSNDRLETEGADRTVLTLPGHQDELVGRVIASNPKTVVVVNTGAPVSMPWATNAAAVLMAWYPGEEGVNALVDVLTGVADPAGRLPITFPARIEDAAAHGFYPGEDGHVTYGEGLNVGYRHFDANNIEPLFAFGHGLSYTEFAFAEPTVEGTGTDRQLTVPVTNTGSRAGSTVVQVYLARHDARAGRPPRQLVGFANVHLDAGATTTAAMTLDARSFARWDVDAHDWVVDPGGYELAVGTSSRAIVHRINITIA